MYATTNVGAPYPNGQIRHAYEKPGHYVIELITKWAGDFTKGFKGDVFAFGVTAYYVSTGKHPYDGTTEQIEQAIRESPTPSPLKSEAQLLRSTAAIIMDCLEKNPDRRPSMEQVARVYTESASLFK